MVGGRRRPARGWAAFVRTAAVVLLIVACGGGRPATAEWRSEWGRLLAAVPERAAFADGPDAGLCSEALVRVREAEADVLPTPDEALDAPVRSWLRTARETFFECPPRSGVVGFDNAYDELDALEAEVMAGLASLDSPSSAPARPHALRLAGRYFFFGGSEPIQSQATSTHGASAPGSPSSSAGTET